MRTSPRQPVQDAAHAVATFIEEHAPFGAEIEITPLDSGQGWAMDPDSPVTAMAQGAMQAAFAVEPVNKGEGGSIPFIPELQRLFPKAQVLVTGPEDPRSNAHSPNESISLSGLKNNIIAEALTLEKLGAAATL